jgi:hypothetical protein
MTRRSINFIDLLVIDQYLSPKSTIYSHRFYIGGVTAANLSRVCMINALITGCSSCAVNTSHNTVTKIINTTFSKCMGGLVAHDDSVIEATKLNVVNCNGQALQLGGNSKAFFAECRFTDNCSLVAPVQNGSDIKASGWLKIPGLSELFITGGCLAIKNSSSLSLSSSVLARNHCSAIHISEQSSCEIFGCRILG